MSKESTYNRNTMEIVEDSFIAPTSIDEGVVITAITNILSQNISRTRVCRKKVLNHYTIFLDNQIKKCVCRIVVQSSSILIFFPQLNKNITLLDAFEIGEYNDLITTSLLQL